MAYYSVRVNLLIVDKKRNDESQNWEYNFNDSSIDLINLRSEAIIKAKSMFDFFQNEMPEDVKFSSPKEAEMKNHKDFKAYSVDIAFINDDNEEEVIFGWEENIEFLISEAYYYQSKSLDVSFTNIEYVGGNYNVLSQNLDFLI